MAAFTSLERRAAASLSLVYATRMMGLFLLLPVMSVLGQKLDGATPLLIGVALGIYGLFQAVLQIPFGLLSDRFGRKPVIYAGLVMLVIGSLVAAAADSIWGVIIGRALQGAGAISAAVMAMAADLSRDDQRTKMMAIIGAAIGLSFVVSIMLGPLLMNGVGLSGIFIVIAGTGVLSALLVRFAVPDVAAPSRNRDFSATSAQLKTVIRHPDLLRLDTGILVLHLLITATFVCVPLILIDRGIAAENHWQVYLTACLLSMVIMIPLISISEKGIKRVMMLAIIGLGLAEVFIAVSGTNWWLAVLSIAVFFGFLNVLESMLPSLVSRIAPVASRGSAMGVYSTSQFTGAFLGGVLGGWLVGAIGLDYTPVVLGVLCIGWLLIINNMQEPPKLSSYQVSLGELSTSKPADIEQRLRAVTGVKEVSVIAEDKVAYLKVARKQLDENALKSALSER